MKLNINKLFFLIVLLTTFPSLVLSYNYYEYNGNKVVWQYNKATMYISTTSFPENSWWDYSLQRAMNSWNNVKACSFNFYLNRDTDGKHNLGNSVNEIYMANSTEFSSTEQVVAVTKAKQTYNNILEKDIAFNPYYTFTDDRLNTIIGLNNDKINKWNFESIALHELGHALGLLHEDNVLATMNTGKLGGGPTGRHNSWEVHGDDRKGCRYLYPDSTSEINVVASKYYFEGNGHTTELWATTRFATRGKPYGAYCSAENLSTTSKQFTIAYYLSTNGFIDKNDIHLGAISVALPVGEFKTYLHTFNIPSNINAGNYYIGCIVDNDELFSSSYESNKAVTLKDLINID